MPSVKTLKRLIEAVSQKDWNKTNEIFHEIADAEEKKGNRNAAREIRSALGQDQTPDKQTQFTFEGSRNFMLSKALIRNPKGPPLPDIVFSQQAKITLDEIVREWNAKEELRKRAIPRRSRLLFHGPPGCGKTAAATALGKALSLPTFVVRFSSLIGSYLGQTAANLHEIFNYAYRNECVVLIDELDVVGKRRGSQQDVGELDRIVVGLMQEMDLMNPAGFIIGATNLLGHLDEALLRRFDITIEFPKPKQSDLRTYTEILTRKHSEKVPKRIKELIGKQSDFASAERLFLDFQREVLLKEIYENGSRSSRR